MILTGSPLLFAIAVPLLAVAGFAAWRTSAQREAQDRALLNAAAQHGWRAQRAAPPEKGVEIYHTGDGSEDEWLVRSLHRVSTTNASRTVSRSRGGSTRWSSPTPALPHDVVVVYAGQAVPPQAMAFGGDFLQALLRAAVTTLAGGDIGPIGTLHAVQTGDDGFDAQFGIITTDPDLVQRLFDDHTRAALSQAEWAKDRDKPGMVIAANGLTIRVAGAPLRSEAHLTRFVDDAKAIRTAASAAVRAGLSR
jgi:hypothetical protein